MMSFIRVYAEKCSLIALPLKLTIISSPYFTLIQLSISKPEEMKVGKRRDPHGMLPDLFILTKRKSSRVIAVLLEWERDS